MSTSKNTPGPWRWEVSEKNKLVKLCGGPRYDLTVMDFERWGMFKALSHADASLIAAAPDLLEAAKGIINSIENGNGVVCYRALIAAIAKAEGRVE